jgi:pimeloyl-ACP methyl ester carboxylesterase
MLIIMPQVQSNGMTIEYEIRGDGEPLLFVMGLTGQLIDWPTEFVDLFVDAGYQAVLFDNRDIGLSSEFDGKPPSRWKFLWSTIRRKEFTDANYTLSDMTDDAAGLLDALGIESAHVMGISMGGMIAQELAISYPDRVRSLCSIMSNTGDRKNGIIGFSLLLKLAKLRPPSKKKAVSYIEKIFELISGPHSESQRVREMAEASVARSWRPDGVARQSAAIAGSRDRTELLASVTAPSLVIHGLADHLVLPSGGTTTATAIPGSRLLAFGDMGHDLPRPRWQEIRDAIVHNCRRAKSESSLAVSEA